MFTLKKTTCVWVVFALTVMGMSLWAQPPDRSRPRRRARPQPKRAAPKTPGTPPAAAPAAEPTPAPPPPPVPPIQYLEAGAKLYNNAQFDLAAKYLDAANRYRDQLQEDDRSTLDSYLKELAKVRAPKAQAPRDDVEAVPASTSKAPVTRAERPTYVVEPPDLIWVEVLEALPGRPISGERLVRPDGKISLGFYGEVDVAGLTISEIKEKIVLNLRKYISDSTLGLVVIDLYTGEPKVDPETGQVMGIAPKDTDSVFVDVTAYNSSNVYIEGDVTLPSRLPYTGGDTVLDLIHHVGGLLPTADPSKIRLIRSYPKGAPAQVLPVDYEQITMGTDSSTNYAVLPNDRLVVPRNASVKLDLLNARGLASESLTRRPQHPSENPNPDSGAASKLYFGRNAVPLPESGVQSDLERRISDIEAKLDRLLEASARAEEKIAGQPAEKPVAEPEARLPFWMEEPDVRSMEPPSVRRRRSTSAIPKVSPPRVHPPAVRPSPGESPLPPEARERSTSRPKRQARAEDRPPSEARPRPTLPDLPSERSPFDDGPATPQPDQPQLQDHS